MSELYDVVEVDISTSSVLRIIATGRAKADAEAVVKMAVWRRGVEDSFFAEVPAGTAMPGETFR